jgi:hypothetical protein
MQNFSYINYPALSSPQIAIDAYSNIFKTGCTRVPNIAQVPSWAQRHAAARSPPVHVNRRREHILKLRLSAAGVYKAVTRVYDSFGENWTHIRIVAIANGFTMFLIAISDAVAMRPQVQSVSSSLPVWY